MQPSHKPLHCGHNQCFYLCLRGLNYSPYQQLNMVKNLANFVSVSANRSTSLVYLSTNHYMNLCNTVTMLEVYGRGGIVEVDGRTIVPTTPQYPQGMYSQQDNSYTLFHYLVPQFLPAPSYSKDHQIGLLRIKQKVVPSSSQPCWYHLESTQHQLPRSPQLYD